MPLQNHEDPDILQPAWFNHALINDKVRSHASFCTYRPETMGSGHPMMARIPVNAPITPATQRTSGR